jgi:DNA modification methylase
VDLTERKTTMGNVLSQQITDRWAIYNGDSMEVMQSYPADAVHLSVYSPPFAGLYHYSSSERDLSNNISYEAFFEHYEHIVRELHRITMPGRRSLVHCMDVPTSNAGRNDGLRDFPGDIIRMHERLGFTYVGRYHVWKEPLTVRNRTMTKGLAHKTIVEDATQCSVASADYLLAFRKRGDNPVPIANPAGLMEYAGEREVPADVLGFRGWTGNQIENRYSHWIWRQYASAFWDDVRLDNVLPFRESRDPDDEKHVHPLQLDVIHRGVQLWSNPGETVLTPFMGVGSEVYEAVRCGRRGVGAELKTSYYKQAMRNLATVDKAPAEVAETLFDAAWS